jgi:hypothetical protein
MAPDVDLVKPKPVEQLDGKPKSLCAECKARAAAAGQADALCDLATDRAAAGVVVGRADVRSSALLGLTGIGLGAAITVLAKSSGTQSTGGVAAILVAWVGALSLAVSVVLLIVAVRPVRKEFPLLHGRVSPRAYSASDGGGSSSTWASHETQVQRICQNVEYIDFLVNLIQRKHGLMRRASDFLLVAVGLFVVAAIIYSAAS